jgi:hypothetical protein
MASCHVSRKPPPTDGILPTRVYCKNINVDSENASALQQLHGASQAFKATDVVRRWPNDVQSIGTDEAKRRLSEALDRKILHTLELKIGAQVTARTRHATPTHIRAPPSPAVCRPLFTNNPPHPPSHAGDADS